jgi:hypothetical protein
MRLNTGRLESIYLEPVMPWILVSNYSEGGPSDG